MNIRALLNSDIPGLNVLPPAGWNYDYEVFLNEFLEEEYFHAFVMTQDEQVVGTGNVLLKDKVGWLANIIISEKYRSQGLGFKITKFLVDFLKSKGCETQLLIATALGEAVYKKLGFKRISEYICFESVADTEFTPNNSIRELKASDLEQIYQLDSYANGENRKHLIDKFWNAGLGYFNLENELRGFYLPNFGRGLVIAKDEKAGSELLKIKHTKAGKRTLLPVENEMGIEALESMGLLGGENLSKMILGVENDWIPECIYSYGSGYCG